MGKQELGHRAFGESQEVAPFDSVSQALEALAPDLPVHFFNPAALKQQARMFSSVFGQGCSYAVKANPSPKVISTLVEAGIRCFDVASVAEAALVKEIAPFARLHYHNPIRTKSETIEALNRYRCTRFAIDDFSQLEKLAVCVPDPGSIEVAVRFKMPFHGQSVHDFSHKFGASPDEAVFLLQQASQLGFKVGVTFHPGSQCENAAVWIDHLHRAHAIVSSARANPVAVNIGGGFAVQYERKANPSDKRQLSQIAHEFAALFDTEQVRLECEPGRALCGPAYQIVARVKAVRRRDKSVFLNDGLYGSLMETAQAPALLPAYNVLRGTRRMAGPMVEFDVYGPTCDPLDRLPNRLLFPADIAEGDYVLFTNAGAYSRATTTRFNGYDCGDEVEVASW